MNTLAYIDRMLNRDRRLMQLARRVAISDPTFKKYYVGAVIADKNKVLSLGFNNNTKTHSYCRHYRKQTIHAEIQALFNLETNPKGLTIYIYRESRAGTRGKSRPCDHCEHELREAGIRRVVYLDIDGRIVDTKIN